MNCSFQILVGFGLRLQYIMFKSNPPIPPSGGIHRQTAMTLITRDQRSKRWVNLKQYDTDQNTKERKQEPNDL